MPNDLMNSKISPPEEVIGILSNGYALAMGQQLTQARDVIRVAKIVADDYHLDSDVVFERLIESVMSKPYNVLPIEFDNAFREIRSLWKKISK